MTQAETNANVHDILPESVTSGVQVIGVPGRSFTIPPNFSTLGIESDGDLTKVNTLDSHTPQTGDSYAIVSSGSYGNSVIQTTVSSLFSTAQSESYPADGADATPTQLLYLLLSVCSQFDVTGTTLTARRLNGTAEAAVYTLDSATEPTARYRSG